MNPLEKLQHSLDTFHRKKCVQASDSASHFLAHKINLEKVPEHYSTCVAEAAKTFDNIHFLAQIFFTDEPAHAPQGELLDYWETTLKLVPNIMPGFTEQDLTGMMTVLSQLFHQHYSESYADPRMITNQLRELKPGESFQLLLPQNISVGSPQLENIAVYKRNPDTTLDIFFYNAASDVWKEQGGEYAAGIERASPIRYYSHVPQSELFGPNANEADRECLHATSLLKAMKAAGEDLGSIASCFHPLEAYRAKPPKPYARMVHVTHAHSLKGINAFLHDCLYQSLLETHPTITEKEVLYRYKAIIALHQLFLTSSLKESLNTNIAFSSANYFNLVGLLSNAIETTARTVNKQRNNPFFQELFPLAASTLNDLLQKADKLNREYIYTVDAVEKIRLKENQEKLALESSRASLNYMLELNRKWGSSPDIEAPQEEKLLPIKPPHDPNQYLEWLTAWHNDFKAALEAHPDMTMPLLNAVVANLPLSMSDPLWSALGKGQKNHALAIISSWSQTVASKSFADNTRFSLAAQNSAIHLLFISYGLAEALDETKVLSHFFPSIEGYQQLSESPFFYVESYKEWEHRQQLLSHHKIHIQGKQPAFAFKGKSEEEITLAIFDVNPKIAESLESKRYNISQESSSREDITVDKLCMTGLLGLRQPNGSPPLYSWRKLRSAS